MTHGEIMKLNRQLKPEGKRYCSTCGNIRKIEDMTKKGGNRYGECKPCRKVSRREYYLKDHEENKRKGREYIALHSEEKKKYYKQYKIDNYEKELERGRKYREENRELCRESSRKSRKKHKNNPYYRFNLRVQKHLRSVEKKELFKEKWDDVRAYYDENGITYHIDHKVPQSWFKYDTEHEIINHIENLQVIDASYNLCKINRWSDEVSQSYLELALPHIKKKYLKKLLAEQNKFVSLSDN